MASVTTLDPTKKLDLFDEYPRTDAGNAERLIAHSGRDLRFVTTWKLWLGWDGRHWTLDDGAPHRSAKAMARTLMKQAQSKGDAEKRAAAIKYALKCESRGAIESMVALARHELAVAISHEQLDADPWLLNVANGTVDLRTGTVRAHARDDLITKIAPVDFDPDAGCERFERFVSEVMADDAALVAHLHAFLGYCVTGDVREHLLSFWYGSGGNGKSLLAAVLLYVLGDYAGKAAPDLLFKSEQTDRHPTELCDLHGRRFVVTNETARGRAWDEATLKDVTGGDRIKARRMHQDFWEFGPTHKLVVFGNTRPRIKNVDQAIERRLRLVPFAVSFVGREDKNLLQTLIAEASGILRWLVDGCIKWQTHGIPEATAVREATKSYLRDEDTLGQFFASECVFGADAKVTRKEIRERYTRWAEERDERTVSAKTFADALRTRGVVERKVKIPAGSRDGWAGVRLATEADRDPASGEVVTSGELFPGYPAKDVSHEINREEPTTGHHSPPDDQETFADYLDGEGIGGDE